MNIVKILSRICKPAFFLSQIILILAVGCSPVEVTVVVLTSTSFPTATVPPQATETGTPLPAETPFEPKAIIKIAGQFPLSGDRADLGTDMMRGAELAVQQLSAPLNEQGYQVELVSYDDQNLAERALGNAQEIVADPDIVCGVGHYDSEISIASSNVYHQASLAFISPSATAPLLTGQSFLEVDRVIGRTDGQGLVAAQFAKDQGFTKFFIVSQKTEISLKNAEAFRVEAGHLGLKRVGSVISNLTPENTANFVNMIMVVKPDLVYISNTADQAIPFLKELRAAGYQGAILGTEKLDNRSMIHEAGEPLINGGMYYTIMNPPAAYYSGASQFLQDFYIQYSATPLSFAARAYDATGICLKAIEEAVKAKGGVLPARADVAKAIRDLNEYKGITGTYSFNDRGDPDPMQYYVYQVVSTDTASWSQNPIVAAYEITPPR